MTQHFYGRVGGDGAILGVQTTHDALDPVPENWIELPEGADRTTHYVLEGVLTPYSEEASARLRAGPGKGGCQWSTALLDWVDLRSLAQARAEKLRQINQAFRDAASELTAGYPAEETLTWGIQQSEALAWQANSSAPTPYLDGLAAERGIDVLDMRQRTLNKVLQFMSASQVLVGVRQRLEHEIEDAQTVLEIDAISWPT